MTARTAATLDAAADILVNNGWRQHSLGDPGGPRCVYGACVSASRTSGQLSWLVANSFLGYLRDQGLCFPSDTEIDWNDAPGRTADEVIAALRAAAGSERGDADE